MKSRWLCLLAVLSCVPAAPESGPVPGTSVPTGLGASLAVQVGERAVTFSLHITNTATEPVVLEFGSAQRYDVEIWSGAERLWRWSEGRAFAAVTGQDVLRPGETREYDVSWPQGGREGNYVAIARLTSRNKPVELRSEFRLP